MTGFLDPAAKRSDARLRRLAPMLESSLADPIAALELLVAEFEQGEARPQLWEALHAAAARDDKEIELGSAYEQLARGRRLKPLPPATQARVLLHGADFLQGIIGDSEGAAVLLERVMAVVPDHPEAMPRLERRYTAIKNDRALATLYANVIAARAEPPVLLIGRALALIELLPADKPMDFEVCERLVGAAGKNVRVAAVLEAHCKKGGRFREAARLLELAIERMTLEPAQILDLRSRLLALYLGDAASPDAAMSQVEHLLEADPENAQARKAAERLLSIAAVAGRAAAALQQSRRAR